jgi:hypothetical protein
MHGDGCSGKEREPKCSNGRLRHHTW